jgi:hypothetical protein
MGMLENIKRRIVWWKDYYPTKFIIYRKRGSTFAPDFVNGVRIAYDNRPNAHLLETGERMPAVDLEYVLNSDTGTPVVHAVEANDDQLVVFKPKFDITNVDRLNGLSKLNVDQEAQDLQEKFENAVNALDIDGVSQEDIIKDVRTFLDTDESDAKIYDRLNEKNFDVVKFCTVDNRDERLTFLAEEFKISDTKYNVSGIIGKYPQLFIVLATAIALGLLFYFMFDSFGQYIPILQDIASGIPSTEQLAQSSLGSGGESGAPPGN